jgi:hypothetical protein
MTFASATTDRDGKYELRGLHALPQQVRIKVEGTGGFATGEPFELAQPGSRHSAGEQKLAPARGRRGPRDRRRPQAGGRRARLAARLGLRAERPAERQRRRGDHGPAGRYRSSACLRVGRGCSAASRRTIRARRARRSRFEVEPGKSYRFDLEVSR